MTYNGHPLQFGRWDFWFIMLMLLMLAGCTTGTEYEYKSPAGYDLSDPVIIKLPLELDEISGVAYYKKDTSIMAINDEFGLLYKIYLNDPKEIQKWKFSDGADFEDVVLLDSTFYVLKSTGDILTVRFDHDTAQVRESIFPVGSGNEFEILYYDSSHRKLMLICKDCELDKKKSLSTYSYDPHTLEYTSDSFKIDVTRIAMLAGEEKMKFKPSAAGIHPLTGELYIVSSVNKLLVIANNVGDAKEVYRIDPKFFKQPEGLTFTPRGTLIISNEAADVGVANVMVFPYRMTYKKDDEK